MMLNRPRRDRRCQSQQAADAIEGEEAWIGGAQGHARPVDRDRSAQLLQAALGIPIQGWRRVPRVRVAGKSRHHPTGGDQQDVLVGVYRVATVTDHDADDAAAFEAWVSPHLQRMALVAARLAPPGERDDVVQEALARAWVKRQQFDPERGTAGAWLSAVTADQARKWRRRLRHPLFNSRPDSGDERESLIDLNDALRRLTDRQRLMIDLYYYVGLSVSEVAVAMRCAPGTVKSTLSDARAKLSGLLDVENRSDSDVRY